MKLFELFDQANNLDDLERTISQVDSIYNREIHAERTRQQDVYRKTGADKGYTPIFTKPDPVSEENKWSTEPKDPANSLSTSPGYIGRENANRRAGNEYDSTVEHKDPHSDPALSTEEKLSIMQARKSLGLDKFNML